MRLGINDNARSVLDKFVFVIEGGWCEEAIDEGGELVEVRIIINFPAVGFGDESSDESPGDFRWRNVGTPLSDRVHPGIDDESCTLVLRVGGGLLA